MPTRPTPFTYRMLFAPTRELIDYAADLGYNWVVVATSGHKTVYRPHEDPPVYMKEYEKLYAIRRKMRGAIEAERRHVSALHRYAKKRGLKVIYNTYELSVPAGFEKAYPEMFSTPLREFRSHTTPEQREMSMCVSRADVREALASKVREICEIFPEIDGFAYTNNESATKTQVWHRCELCRRIPYAKMMKYLHDAIKEGIRRSGRDVKLFNRCWGSHETDFKYYDAYKYRVLWGAHEVEDKGWLPAHVEAYKPANLHFKPSRDIPAYLRLMSGEEDTGFIYKASWADNNLHHPLNPWIGKYKDHDQISEISYEHAFTRGRVFYIMGREMQRRARLCRREGVNGLCTLSVSWGAHDGGDARRHPSMSMLGELNLYLMSALNRNPDANLERVTANYLRGRYGKELPAQKELVGMLLDSEDIAADAMNIHGIRSTSNGEHIPTGFHGLITSFLRYGPMYKDWKNRLTPTGDNLKRIFRTKERNLARAEAITARIDALKKKLPGKAYREFSECFAYLLTMARSFEVSHKLFLTMWAMRQGYAQSTTKNLNEMHELIKRYAEILPLNPPRQR